MVTINIFNGDSLDSAFKTTTNPVVEQFAFVAKNPFSILYIFLCSLAINKCSGLTVGTTNGIHDPCRWFLAFENTIKLASRNSHSKN